MTDNPSATELIEDAVRKVVAAAPLLSDEQREQVSRLLASGGRRR